jgi:glycosyltransferase involved in cell wall biosynthesis
MRLSVIIPVYDEKATFSTLLAKVLAAPLPGGLEKEVIVVDDASTDGTRDLVRACAGRPGIKVVLKDPPRGKGTAVRRGLKESTGDFLLVQDADLEYDPADYARLLAPLLDGSADAVLGSRVLDAPQRWQFRRFHGLERVYGLFVNAGGVMFTGLFNLLYGTALTDGATMFKLFRTADLRALDLWGDGFDYDWEILAKFARRGLRFVELPVSYHARGRAEGKKIRFWRDGARVLTAIVRWRISD